jgi:hypothetical protein
MMKRTLTAACDLVLMALQSGYAQETLGLQVKEGRFYKEGQPYRGVGANYFDLFRRVLSNPTNTTSLAGLEQLSKAGIPFVRFVGPFSAQEWRLYLDGVLQVRNKTYSKASLPTALDGDGLLYVTEGAAPKGRGSASFNGKALLIENNAASL